MVVSKASAKSSSSSSSSLSFYNGKVPLGAGLRRPSATKVPDVLPSSVPASIPSTSQQPLPSFCKRDALAPAPPAPAPLPSKSVVPGKRPSLSEQLAAIGSGASAITASLVGAPASQASSSSAGPPPVLSIPSSSLVVGSLAARYPSPLVVYPTYFGYVFYHPFQQKEIHMEMHYRDFTHFSVVAAGAKTTIRWRLGKPLREFGADYNHEDPRHFVAIEMVGGGGGMVKELEETVRKTFRK